MPRPPSFECVLSSPKATWSLGEQVELQVRIVNRSDESHPLIGSLDASDVKWRYPHCTFEVIGPDGAPVGLGIGGRCGNMNNLRLEDIVTVKPGESFDPYMQIDNGGFFSHAIHQRNALGVVGQYRVRFQYSTEAESEREFLGDMGRMGDAGAAPSELSERLARLPRIHLESNELVLLVVQ